MVYRGCVIKIEKDFAIVLTDTMEYIKIVKKEGLIVGKKIIFVEDDLYKKKSILKNVGFVAAIFIIIILSMTFIEEINIVSPVSHAIAVVSIDINPSIEFEIDKENKVTKVIPLNSDAKELIDKKFIGTPVEEVISVVITNAKQKHFLTEEKNSVLIATATIDGDFKESTKELEEKIKEKVKTNNSLEGVNLIYVQGNEKDVKEAKDNEISIGKYEIYKKSKEKNENVTIQQIKTMKVQEIVELESDKLKIQVQKDRIDKKIDKKLEQDKKKNVEAVEKNKINKQRKKKEEIKIKKEKKSKELVKDNRKEYSKLDRDDKKEKIKEFKGNKKENIKERKDDKKQKIEERKESIKDKIEKKKENRHEKLKSRKENKKNSVEKKKNQI